MTQILTSRRIPSDTESAGFTRQAVERGWADGLPCIPPTEALVSQYIEAVGRPPDEVIAVLPPSRSPCAVEKIAINAAMTAAAPAAMPLLCAAIEALSEPDFALGGVNATTAPVSPALIVNGPMRHALDIPFGPSCLGGADSAAPAIGRALRLIMRNVAGQRPGQTTESVFGQPARVVSLVAAEWEEESPWLPLAARRGIDGDAVTVFPMMGSMNVVDTIADSAESIVQMLGRSAGYLGANGFLAATELSQILIAINPVWAEIVGRRYKDAEVLQELLWEEACLPISVYPASYRAGIEALERVGADGRVHLLRSPHDVLVMVCGGMGSLHSTVLHGFTSSLAVTRPVVA